MLPPQSTTRPTNSLRLVLLALVLGLVVSLLPAPYVIDQPGPVFDTLGTVTDKGEEVPMISIPGEETYPTDGELNLLTVNQRGNPDDLPNWTEVLLAWFNGSKAVLPVSEVYPEGVTSEQIAEGVKAIVDKLKEKLPETKILVLAIFPRGATKDDARRKVNEGANALIAKLADDKQVFFLDIGPKFLKEDGTLSKEIMPDLLHLNEASYRIWAEATEAKVAQLLGEK